MKTCTKCDHTLNNSEFYRKKSGQEQRREICKTCTNYSNKKNLKKYRSKNSERLNQQKREWYSRNKEEVKAYMEVYRYNNKEHAAIVQKAWIENNKERHRAIKNACNAQRRFSKKCATVEWADKAEIKKIYLAAQMLSLETGVEHHVDHIVPLINDKVCGLHCEDNLQVLPWYDNIAKGNSFSEDIV